MLIDFQADYTPMLNPATYPGRIVVCTDHELYCYTRTEVPVLREDDRYKEYDITPPFEDRCHDYMVPMDADEEDRPDHFPAAPLKEIDIHISVDLEPPCNELDYYCSVTVACPEALTRAAVVVRVGAAVCGS